MYSFVKYYMDCHVIILFTLQGVDEMHNAVEEERGFPRGRMTSRSGSSEELNRMIMGGKSKNVQADKSLDTQDTEPSSESEEDLHVNQERAPESLLSATQTEGEIPRKKFIGRHSVELSVDTNL